MAFNFDEIYTDLLVQSEYLGQHPLDTWLALERHVYPHLGFTFRLRIWTQLCERGYREVPEPWSQDSWARWLSN